MPPVSQTLRKDSVQFSKRNSPGSASSLSSTESCFPNYTTSSLGYINDESSSASSSAHRHSSQTLDTESAYTNESSESAHSRVPSSHKKVKVKRAVEPPSRGTTVALRMFSSINQSHGVSYNKTSGVFKTPDVKIMPASKDDNGSRADGSLRGSLRGVRADEERVNESEHNKMTPESILRGGSVPAKPSYPNASDGQQKRSTDSQRAKQQASPYQNNGFAAVRLERNTAGDRYGEFNSKEMAAFNEVIKHNYSQRGSRVDLTSTRDEDHRSAGASSAQLVPDDPRCPQQRPTSNSSIKPALPRYGSSRDIIPAPTTPRDRSPDDIRGRSPTQRRPDVLSSRRNSYERIRPNDREHRQPGHDEPNPAYTKDQSKTIQGTDPHSLTKSPPQPPSTPPPPPPPPRLVYLHCGHPYIDDLSCTNAYKADPRFEYLLLLPPNPLPHRSHTFNAANLSDAALRDLKSWYQDVRAPRWRAIKQHLHDNHPDDREEIGKMERDDVVKGLFVHVHDHGRGDVDNDRCFETMRRGGSLPVTPATTSTSISPSTSSSHLAVPPSRKEDNDKIDNNNDHDYNSEKWRRGGIAGPARTRSRR